MAYVSNYQCTKSTDPGTANQSLLVGFGSSGLGSAMTGGPGLPRLGQIGPGTDRLPIGVGTGKLGKFSQEYEKTTTDE